ncbi:hypothetical protein OIU77_020161 [Salix suchowensis]|uniref:Uncharacterized protein n=1 Tax=Salix suchowensis TaxID=1278906 RepID=A0ABQ9CIU9_9ROSI|nr:hypothetical protein OIU77_020161 [Salix suchowensis]
MPTSLLRSINVFPSSILPRKTSPSVISARTNGLSCSVNKTGRFYAEIVTVQYTQQTSIPRKHNRFLLTGAKLSATSSVYMSSSSSVTSSGDLVPDSKPQKHPPQQSIKKPVSAAPGFGSTTSSTISEYLMETLPGWHVEEFLDSSPTTPFGFCKIDDGLLPYMATHDLERDISSFSSESLGLWVPQAPPPLYTSQQYYYPQSVGQSGFKETKETTNMKASRRFTDDAFTVPQISPPSNTGSKRSRPLW